MRIIGVDVGTMNIVSSVMINSENQIQSNSMRNMFLPVDSNALEINELTDSHLDYVVQKNEDNEDQIFIIGEDAFKFSQIFGSSIKRPMNKGVISTGEIDAIDVLTIMLDRLIGQTANGFSVYSIPSQAVDTYTPPVLYHKKVFSKIFKTLGYDSKPINEALAIIFAECKPSNFTGISISFGAGLTNVCCAYKGQPTIDFAISRGRDWIDENVATSIGIINSRVTSIKERDLDLLNSNIGKKKERRIREALTFYYEELIEYVLLVFTQQFELNSEGLDIDEKIPIVVSGGTSKPKNFVKLFKNIFYNNNDFPYDISEIRQAEDPLTSVSKGCLIYGLWEIQKRNKINSIKPEEPKTK